MEEKILELVYNYSIANKLADRSFIEKIIYIVVENENLNKYFKDLKAVDRRISEDDTVVELASYNPVTKIITIYAEAISRLLTENDYFDYYLQDIESIFNKNLKVAQVVLHELEHVEQCKIIDEKKDIESDILRVSMRSNIVLSDDGKLARNLFNQGIEVEQIIKYVQESQKRYRKGYEYAPEERLAEIKSYRKIINIIKPLEQYIPKINKIEECKYLSNLLRGYEEEYNLLAPTIGYFNYCGHSSSLENFAWYLDDYMKCLEKSKEQYELLDRLKYGLPIEWNEYEHVKEGIQYKLSDITY